MSGVNRLNLGCGDEYRPAYTNVDKYGKVVDIRADVMNLPFKMNGMDEIYASQLIEHFDHIQCKYVLSEWFITLKPGGKLILETPDLKKSFKRLLTSKEKERGERWQWMYGIDSPGMQHKVGFSFGMLKNLLSGVGFVDVQRERQRTHKYEPGLRVTCKKPRRCRSYQKFSLFRTMLLKRLDLDSFFLIPMEEWIGDILTAIERDSLNVNIISKGAVCHPVVSSVLLRTFGDKVKDFEGKIKHLEDIQAHKKIFTLWMNANKSMDIRTDYEKFVEKQLTGIKKFLTTDEDLNYLERLNGWDIGLFDFKIILVEAKKEYNLGVKYFLKRKLERAQRHFTNSAKMNYSNPLTHWNLGRLNALMGKGNNAVEREYRLLLDVIRERKTIKKVEGELEVFIKKGIVPNNPIPWKIS